MKTLKVPWLIIRSCSWCDGFMGIKFGWVSLRFLTQHTHGICPKCSEKLVGKVNKHLQAIGLK